MIDIHKHIHELIVETQNEIHAKVRNGKPEDVVGIGIRLGTLRQLEEWLGRQLSADYLGELYRTAFDVTGKGAFPIDMLRYVSAWPYGEEDAQRIVETHEEESSGFSGRKVYVVRLQKYHRDPTPSLGEERWLAKFHWQVLPGHETTLL